MATRRQDNLKKPRKKEKKRDSPLSVYPIRRSWRIRGFDSTPPGGGTKSSGTNASGANPTGVNVRARVAYATDLSQSVASVQSAMSAGGYQNELIRLPGARATPLYRAAGGDVARDATRAGYIESPASRDAMIELISTGGLAGGYLSWREAPSLPLGGRQDASEFLGAYLSRLPGHVDADERQNRWYEASDTLRRAAMERTDPAADEWSQAFFRRIRAAAAARNPVNESGNAVARGPRYFTNSPSWAADEYHGSSFRDMAAAATQARLDAQAAQQAAPPMIFAHSEAARRIALAAERAKNGETLGSQLYGIVENELAGGVQQALQGFLETQAQAMTSSGGALARLRKAFDVLDVMNQTGATALLAGLLDKHFFPTEPVGPNRGKPNPVNLDQLRGQLIGKLSQYGVQQGLEKLVGPEVAGLLKKSGVTDLLNQVAQNALFGEEGDLSGLADAMLENLPGNLIDFGFDQLVGNVDDRSPMVRQLAAKYQDQIKSLLKSLITPGGLDAIQDQWNAIWKGIPSSACVPFGLAEPGGGADIVLVNGVPTTRLADICKMPMVPDAGPFFQGNPTILVNGMPPAGAIHAARGAKNTIATPMLLSPNVLMGEATVTVQIKVEPEAPTSEREASASASGAPANDDGESAGAESDGESSTGSSSRETGDLDNGEVESRGPDLDDAAAGIKEGAKHADKEQQDAARRQQQADQQRLDSDAERLDGEYQRAQTEADQARAEANQQAERARAEAYNAQSNADYLESQQSAREAGDAQARADQLQRRAEGLSDAAEDARARARAGANMPEIDPRFGRIASAAGIAGDLFTLFQGVAQARDALQRGDDRAFNRAIGGTGGDLIGGGAGAAGGAAIGAGIGAIFFGAGAVPGAIIGGFIGGFLGGDAGRDIGEQLADNFSDYRGHRRSRR